MNRKDKMLYNLGDIKFKKGIEFGAGNNPVILKSESDIIYVDKNDSKILKKMFKNEELFIDIQIDNMIFSKHFELESVDYIVASHVFEHLPNPIKWLEELYKILKMNGIISLAIPDKRCCFDYKRNLTILSDIIEPYIQKREKISERLAFDAIYNFVTNDNKICWCLNDPINLINQNDINISYNHIKNMDSEYINNLHNWVFSPESFVNLIKDLKKLNLISYDIISFFDNVDSYEFIINLKKI